MLLSLRRRINAILVAITALLILRIIAWEYTHQQAINPPRQSHTTNTKPISSRNLTALLSYKPLTMQNMHTHSTRNNTTRHKLFHAFDGRLGNQLFQWASLHGIARAKGLDICLTIPNELLQFDGPTSCFGIPPKTHLPEVGHSTYTDFTVVSDTYIDGYLQSYRYFDPGIVHILRPHARVMEEASTHLHAFRGKTLIGIHIRHYEAVYLRRPPEKYFRSAMLFFRSTFQNAQFIVASDNIDKCRAQEVLQGDDVHLLPAGQRPVVDMTILSLCDHFILSVGTFGWWAAFLGPGSRGGTVVYYDREFDMAHPTNKNRVVLSDYYPRAWVSMGTQAPYALAAVVMLRIFDGDRMRHTFREVREWMAWLRHAGVQHIYVYDNWLDPGESQERFFAPYVAQNLVTYTSFPGLPYAQRQLDAYAHWLRAHRAHAEWVFVGDFDEYPHVYADEGPGFLRRLVAEHACAVYFQNQFWVDVEQNKSEGEWLAERYVRRDRHYERFPYRSKAILATEHLVSIQVHGGTMRPPCRDTFFVVSIESGALEHYWGTRMVESAADPRVEKFYANTVKPDLRMAHAVRTVKTHDTLSSGPQEGAAAPRLAHQAAVLADVRARHAWETQGQTCTPWVDRPAPHPESACAHALASLAPDPAWCPVPCPRELGTVRAQCPGVTFAASMENDGTCVAGNARRVCMSVDSRADVHMQYLQYADLAGASQARPAPPLRGRTGCLASFVSNCVAWRTSMLREISDALQTRNCTAHHYGRCLHNTLPVSNDPAGHYTQKNALAAQHRYTFAFENSETPGYVTEKLFYILGVPTTVAVYRGAADVHKFLPAQDAAWVFPPSASAEDIARALAAESDTAYAQRHRWRNASWDYKFLANNDYSVWHSTCRACVRIQSIQQPPSPASGLWVREMGSVAFHAVSAACMHEPDDAALLTCIAAILDAVLSKHERGTRPRGVGAVVLLYRAWDREKCPLLSRDALQGLPPGTELEAVLENPGWTRRQ